MRVVKEENTYNDIFVKIPDVSYFDKVFTAKIETIAELFNVIEELYFENQRLKEQLEKKEEH